MDMGEKKDCKSFQCDFKEEFCSNTCIFYTFHKHNNTKYSFYNTKQSREIWVY